MLKREQPRSIEEYSTALRERLAGVLPPDKVEEVVAETKCHLEERAEELRRRADVFEKQAVTEFIPARKLAGGINRAWAATYLRHRGTKWLQGISATLCMLALLLFLTQFLCISKLPVALQNSRYVSNLLLSAPVVVFFLALLACRPQLRRFTYGGLGAMALFTLLGGWLCFSGKSMAPISRFDAPAHYQDSMAMHQFHQNEAKLLREGIQFYNATFTRPEAIDEYKKLNADLFMKLEYLKFFTKRSKDAKTIDQLREGVVKAHLRIASLKRRSGINSYSPEYPKSLMVGKRYLVPRRVSDTEGSSAFRKMTPAGWAAVFADTTGRFERERVTVRVWQNTVPESAATPTEALLRWNDSAALRLSSLQDAAARRNQYLKQDMAVMTSSRWRFDTAAAREIGTLGLYAVGVLVAADTVGGFLGMFLLRAMRRRRQLNSGGLAA